MSEMLRQAARGLDEGLVALGSAAGLLAAYLLAARRRLRRLGGEPQAREARALEAHLLEAHVLEARRARLARRLVEAIRERL